MSYSLNSLKGGYIRDYIGDCYCAYKGRYWSLDYGSYEFEVLKADVGEGQST